MQYHDDKQGSKAVFLIVIIIFIYLAFFDFDVKAALDAAIGAQIDFFRALFN